MKTQCDILPIDYVVMTVLKVVELITSMIPGTKIYVSGLKGIASSQSTQSS